MTRRVFGGVGLDLEQAHAGGFADLRDEVHAQQAAGGLDGMSFEEGIARGAEVNAIARGTDACREGVRRFLDGHRSS